MIFIFMTFIFQQCVTKAKKIQNNKTDESLSVLLLKIYKGDENGRKK